MKLSTKLGVRAKVWSASLASIVVVGLITVVTQQILVGDWLRDRLIARLAHDTATAALSVQHVPAASTAQLQSSAAALAQASGARVTMVAPSGVVLADTAPPGPGALGNHGQRPEIREARAEGIGVAVRESSTVGAELAYVARVLPSGVVLRMARPTAASRATLSKLFLSHMPALLVGALLALLVSSLAVSTLTRTLRRLVVQLRAVADGRATQPLELQRTDEMGELAGSVNRVSNVLKKTVSTLARERELSAKVLGTVKEGILVVESEGAPVLGNRAACKMLGQRVSTSGAGPAWRTIPTERLPADLAPLLGLSDSDRSRFGDVVLEGPPRRVIKVRTSPRPGGATVLVMRDMTERRRLETVRRDFAANVSHELRTPVSVIRANAETLLEGAIEDTEMARRFVGAIDRNAARLSNIISDMLELSRIEAGRYPMKKSRFALAALFAEVLAGLEDDAERRGHRVALELEPGARVWAARQATEIVLSNLLSNALKYTPPGGIITLGARRSDRAVLLSVADTGPGIPEEHRERVFERFFRIDAGRSRKVGGTGLGLSLVRHLVDRMGGRVWVEPAEPHTEGAGATRATPGARFCVELPVAWDDEPPGEDTPALSSTDHLP